MNSKCIWVLAVIAGSVVACTASKQLTVPQAIKKLGFMPHIYSPEYSLVNKAMADYCHRNKMKLVPWTVNDKEKMKNLIADGVDGIITDYPNYFAEIGR